MTGLDISVDVLCGNRQEYAKFLITSGWKFENQMVNAIAREELCFPLF